MLSLARTNTTFIGRWWWTIDRWTFASLCTLIALGVLLIMAASPAVATQHNWSSFHFIKKHLLFLIPTLGLLIGCSLLSIKQAKMLALVLFSASMAGLIFTIFGGIEIKGARRWIEVGGLSLQPSEFIKPAFAVLCAWMFAKQQENPTFPGWWVSISLYLLVILFLLLQPDLGMVALITAICFSQFFIAGIPLRWVGSAIGSGIVGLLGAYFLFPHVSRRINHFLNPDVGDKFGARYQITQSLDAFMNGGFIGKGPGEGTIKKHIPDAHADFIYAVAGEEFGFILCLCIAGLFAFIILRSIWHLFNEKNVFIVLAVSGLIVQFGLQAIINMASTLNLMPTKGMTLPFISYGGSSMLALAIGMGLVIGLTRRRIGESDV